MPHAAGGALDAFGRAVLDFIDYRIVTLTAASLVASCALISWWRHKKWPAVGDVLRACLGVVTAFTGLVVLCVFGLTKPPYIEAISHEGLVLVGLVTFFSCLIFGVRELLTLTDNKE